MWGSKNPWESGLLVSGSHAQRWTNRRSNIHGFFHWHHRDSTGVFNNWSPTLLQWFFVGSLPLRCKVTSLMVINIWWTILVCFSSLKPKGDQLNICRCSIFFKRWCSAEMVPMEVKNRTVPPFSRHSPFWSGWALPLGTWKNIFTFLQKIIFHGSVPAFLDNIRSNLVVAPRSRFQHRCLLLKNKNDI